MIRVKSVTITSGPAWSQMALYDSWNSIYRNLPNWKFHTSNVAIVNQPIKIEVLVEEADWGNVKRELTNWNQIKAYKNWQALKDF